MLFITGRDCKRAFFEKTFDLSVLMRNADEIMNKISLKGILAGILASLMLAMPVGFIHGLYSIEIYNEITANINLDNENEVRQLDKKLVFHPLSIAFSIIAMLLTVGMPAYITALVARKGYVLNAVITAAFVSLLWTLDFEAVVQDPLVFGVSAVFALVVACLSGFIRYRQVTKNTT